LSIGKIDDTVATIAYRGRRHLLFEVVQVFKLHPEPSEMGLCGKLSGCERMFSLNENHAVKTGNVRHHTSLSRIAMNS
jgi:hypothetical protein